MDCPFCNVLAHAMGCKVSSDTFYWCPRCGAIKPCTEEGWIETINKAVTLLAQQQRCITVGNEVVRVITFTDLGQRVEQWLPAGVYEVLGNVRIAGAKALLLISVKEPTGQWYVSPAALAKAGITVPALETEVKP